MAMSPRERQLARASLVAVWLWTAVASAQQAHGMSVDLLRANARIPEQAYPLLIWSGTAVDLLLGLLMALWPSPRVYIGALIMTLAMTLVATFVDATLWLHPLGPLSKNLPIVVLLWMLASDARSSRYARKATP